MCLKFGEPLGDGYDTPEAVAKEIDRQVLDNLQMFAVNYWALSMLASDEDQNTREKYGHVWSHVKQLIDLSDVTQFEARLESCPENLRSTWLTMYANPLVNKFNNGSKNLTPYER